MGLKWTAICANGHNYTVGHDTQHSNMATGDIVSSSCMNCWGEHKDVAFRRFAVPAEAAFADKLALAKLLEATVPK